jgi:hypothetical protein
MPIDTSILGSYQPPKQENLFNTLAQFEAIRSAQQQGQMNAMQIQKAQREQEREQQLNALYSQAYNPQTGTIDPQRLTGAMAQGGFGSMIPGAQKGFAEAEAAKTEARRKQVDLSKAQYEAMGKHADEFSRLLRPDMNPDVYKAMLASKRADPTLGPIYDSMGQSLQDELAEIDAAVQSGTFPDLINREIMGAKEVSKISRTASAIADAKKYADQAFGPPVRDKSAVGQPTPLGQGRDVAANEVQFGQAPVDPVAYALTIAERLDDTGHSDLAKNYRDEAKFAFERQTAGLTSDLKEYEYARKFDKFTGTFEQWQKRIKPLSAASTTVQLPPSEKAEQTKRGEFLLDQYKKISEQASSARRMLTRVDLAESILDKGFRTGWGAEVQTKAASFLGAFGVEDASKYAANSQTFLAMVREVVFDRMLEQKGPQTDNDARRLDQTAASLTNEREANKFLLSAARAISNRDIKQQKFYADWYKKNKTYDGAEDAWLEGEGAKSIFTEPALKNYAPAKPAPKVGDIVDGWRFKGGDPKDQKSWEKAK